MIYPTRTRHLSPYLPSASNDHSLRVSPSSHLPLTMAIFYVYVNGTTFVNGAPETSTRVLLTCQSRYVADELFMFLETLKHPDGSQWFNSLKRSTPQFWHFDTFDDIALSKINEGLASAAFLSDFRTTVMPKILGSSSDISPEWPIIPVVDGPDWVHNGVYFIRTRQRPDRYWYLGPDKIIVSETQRSKFRISRVTFALDHSEILIRSDAIQIQPLEINLYNRNHINKDPQNKLVLTRTPGEWQFGDLLGRFKESPNGNRWLLWTDGEDGDDWELC